MDRECLTKELLECFESVHTDRLVNRLKLNYKGENVILFLLSEMGGSSTPGQLSERVDFTAARLSVIIKTLESKGYVERIKNKKDKRSSIIAITDEGRRHYYSLRHQAADNAFTIIEKLGEEDVTQMLRIIKRLAVIVNSMEEI